MFRSLDITSTLKSDILELKKELSALKNENHLFKVKIRKLQNEINKKDRQIETLIDPDKSFLIKRVISEKGASMIVTLRDRIKKLEKTINEKDGIVKRLQNDLQTKKLYTLKSADKKKAAVKRRTPFVEDEFEHDLQSLQSIYKSVSLHDISNEELDKKQVKQNEISFSTRRSMSADRFENNKKTAPSNHDTKAQYEGLPRSRLLSIIENLKNNQQRLSPVRRCPESPESDIERCELQCETPHPEIQQLQNYFMDILGEVDHLKVTILSLKNEQDKTSSILNAKDSSIKYLTKEVELLKKPSTKNKSGLTDSMGHLRTQQKIYLEEITQQSSNFLNSILQPTTNRCLRNDFLCLNEERKSPTMDEATVE